MTMLRVRPGATASAVRNAQSIRRFVEVLFLCLVELYDFSPAEATATVARLVERSPDEMELLSDGSVAPGWMYHSQPIHVAADAAGKPGPIGEKLWSRYRGILDRFEGAGAKEGSEHAYC